MKNEKVISVGLSDKDALMAPKKENIITRIRKNPAFPFAALMLIAIILIAGFQYWEDMQSKIYIEKSLLTAPIISISPSRAGAIGKLYVSVGDLVSLNQPLAKVGDETVRSKSSGIVVNLRDTIGQFVSPPDYVVQMVNPSDLRVVGRIQEDKGLTDIKVGQKVLFTVDAYGDAQFQGSVEKIAPSARQSDIVFSISDKRQENEFDITVRYDTSAYPQLKNGMSAKMWIYK